MIIRKPKFTMLLCILLHASPAHHAYDVPGYTPNQIIPYKQTLNSTGGAVTLNLHVFTPPGHQPSASRPAIVFFFGGWANGSPSQFNPHCEYLASRGMVAISAEYLLGIDEYPRVRHHKRDSRCQRDGHSRQAFREVERCTDHPMTSFTTPSDRDTRQSKLLI